MSHPNCCIPKMLILVLVLLLLTPTTIARAADGALPAPVIAPRLSPAPNPHPYVHEPDVIADYMQNPPPSALEAYAYGDQAQEAPGRGVSQVQTEIGSGLTLFPDERVCNDFNRRRLWSIPAVDIWTAWYGGWAPFALDNDYYRAANVIFSREENVGPGRHASRNSFSAKISSTQPYAAGFGSPLFKARPGATVTVSVKYLIWNHDQGNYDWASMGVKPDATGDVAEYVNGYVRGRWAELSHTITVGPTGQFMVLLQASSPAALNSNIYYDDVKIKVNDRYIGRCF